MAKTKTKKIYVCHDCGAQYPKWQGKCSECNAWNTIHEEVEVKAPSERGWEIGKEKSSLKSLRLDQSFHQEDRPRISTENQELDRVLGGGLVEGAFLLLGGDPGIGKSTLLLQVAGYLAKKQQRVLYVSGEESLNQTGLRAQRLGVQSSLVSIASENNLESILNLAKKEQPNCLIVDSIQTIYMNSVSSAPGSVSQVRECAGQLMVYAKQNNCIIFLIGHVTKDGSIAGPKVLEHMVDTVLSFEGDMSQQFRLLRSIKNRFGPAQQLGVFQMFSTGLVEVSNPSELFLEQRGNECVGSAVFASMDGTRPLLCEIQALVSSSNQPYPRRTAIGVNTNRIHLLIAVLDKHVQSKLFENEVYVNVVGGLKIEETAMDLAIAAALLSSEGNQELDPKSCFFGEIGLTGEVRAVTFVEQRIREGNKLGFERFFLPESNRKACKELSASLKKKLVFVSHIRDLEKKIYNFSSPKIQSLDN